MFGKVRNSKSDDEMKIILINQYNKEADDLPNHYYEVLDLNVICDIILDLFRFKSKTIIDAQALVQTFNEGQMTGKPLEMRKFLAKMVGGKNYQSIFEDFMKIVKQLYEKRLIKKVQSTGFYICESLLTE